MGKFEGKVAFVTGAARGQGRSHAVRLAAEGADIIAVDICAQIATANYDLPKPDDLADTVAEIEALGRRIVAVEADVRDFEALRAAVDEGVSTLGRLDVVAANAGIGSKGRAHELSEQAWQDMIDVNLTGVWHTTKAAIPHLLAGGRGGAIVLTSSAAGLKAYENIAHYVSAKHGVIGLTRALALELAPQQIRVNAVCPSSVGTPMILNEATYRLFAPDLSDPTEDQIKARFAATHPMGVPYLDPVDVSNALVFLASDEARYITGVALPIDAGILIK